MVKFCKKLALFIYGKLIFIIFGVPVLLIMLIMKCLNIEIPKSIWKIYGAILDELYCIDIKNGSIKEGYEDSESVRLRIMYDAIKDYIDKM